LMPAWVSRQTSFILRLQPAVGFTKMVDILRSPDFGIAVDLQPQNDKFQIKGKGIREETITYFKKKMYRNVANEVVVECTKQDGCVVLFNKVYQRLLAALGNEAQTLGETTIRSSSQLSFPPPPPLQLLPSSSSASSFPASSSTSSSSSESSSLLRNLLRRAASQFLDEQFQACQALVSATKNSGSAAWWRELGDVDVFAAVTCLLKSECEDTAHLATVLLLNLFQNDVFREAPPAMVVALFELLDLPPTFKNQDTKRHVSQGLRVISQLRKQTFSTTQRSTLEFYEKSQDPVLRGNALAILQLVA